MSDATQELDGGEVIDLTASPKRDDSKRSRIMSEAPGAKNSRARGWCFTWNNPGVGGREFLGSILENAGASYYVVGDEVGKSGTPHLQGFVYFPTQRTFGAIKKLLLNKAHIEVVRSIEASIDYCKKDGKFVEWGVKPLSQKEKGEKGTEFWDGILRAAKAGNFDDIPSKVQITHCRSLDYIHNRELLAAVPEDTIETNYWFVGPTGTGKSRKARDLFANNYDVIYIKNQNKWWCGYDVQKHLCALVDDIGLNASVMASFFKNWLDRYPFLAEKKNGGLRIRPPMMIITSNYFPQQIWQSPEDHEAILRRVQVVWFGPKMNNYPFKVSFFPEDLPDFAPIFDKWLVKQPSTPVATSSTRVAPAIDLLETDTEVEPDTEDEEEEEE